MAATIQVRCSACGTLLQFPRDRAGTISICAACRAPVEVPELPLSDEGLSEPLIQAPPIPPAPEPMAASSIDALHRMAEMAARAEAAATPQPAPAPAPEPPTIHAPLSPAAPPSSPGPVAPQEGEPRESNLVIWVSVAGAFVVILTAVLIIWLGIVNKPTWEKEHRAEVMALIHSAEDSAMHGDPAGAWRTYHKLHLMVQDQNIADPELQQELDTARDREAKMLELMAQASQNPPAPPATSQPAVAQTGPGTPTTEPVAIGPTPPAPVPVPAPAPNPAPTSAPARVASLQRPNIQPLPWPPPAQGPTGANIPDDAQIGRSIRQGVDFLLSKFNSQGHLQEDATDSLVSDGADALVVYALLQAGDAIDDSRLSVRGPFMSQALDTLKKMSMDNSVATYGRGLRALALSLAGRPEDQPALKAELAWLRHAGETGAFTYVNRIDEAGRPGVAQQPQIWDNSNTQYGLLGVWAVADAGIEVPDVFWYKLQQHWFSTQFPDGEWGYTEDSPSGSPSMTFAGIASLFVTHDYLSAYEREAEPLPTQLLEGLEWLETDDHCVITDRGLQARYALYGLERVGLASGFKYFGGHNWYPEMASALMADQQMDGSWGQSDAVLETSFAVLFLSRGRHPVMASKLRIDGDWDDHPRDLANLAHFASIALERPLNWQVVPATRPSAQGESNDDEDAWRDWSDAPVLLISSDKPPVLDSSVEKKLRNYILNGGLLVLQTEDNSAKFQAWSNDLGLRLFPDRQWKQLPPNHPLYNVALPVSTHPTIMAIDNGARLLVINLPQDLTVSWRTRIQPAEQSAMNLGVNLFVYTCGKTEFRNRLESSYIPPVPQDKAPLASMNMALVLTGAEPDPEPAAWTRFANWFRRQTNLEVKETGPITLEELGKVDPVKTPLAHLTGVAAWQTSDTQVAAVQQYVSGGGVLLIDPCGGPNGFDQSARELLTKAFPNDELDTIDPNHPLLTNSADGMSNIRTAQVRLYVRDVALPNGRQPEMLRSGKGAVIVSPLDLTCGVLGLNHWGIAGYQPAYCLNFAKNVVLWTWDGAKDGQ